MYIPPISLLLICSRLTQCLELNIFVELSLVSSFEGAGGGAARAVGIRVPEKKIKSRFGGDDSSNYQ